MTMFQVPGILASVVSSVLNSIGVWIREKAEGTRRRQKMSQMLSIFVTEVGGSSSILLVKMVVTV